MRYIIDTCVLICILQDDRKKLGNIYDLLIRCPCEIFVSVASYWEIAIKKNLGKLSVPNNLAHVIEESGFKWLTIDPLHIDMLSTLPLYHHDPFDRLLVAQSKISFMQLLTLDEKVKAYFV